MFSDEVYEKLKLVPYGKVTTYKIIAESLGTKAYRAVGNALNRNKHPDTIPCFKVVNSDGSRGGFSKGKDDKIRRLSAEGIEVVGGKIKDFEKRLYLFR